jgi:hypothetical protein
LAATSNAFVGIRDALEAGQVHGGAFLEVQVDRVVPAEAMWNDTGDRSQILDRERCRHRC